jgi:membrane protease YdiL (CAAX protease family)
LKLVMWLSLAIAIMGAVAAAALFSSPFLAHNGNASQEALAVFGLIGGLPSALVVAAFRRRGLNKMSSTLVLPFVLIAYSGAAVLAFEAARSNVCLSNPGTMPVGLPVDCGDSLGAHGPA